MDADKVRGTLKKKNTIEDEVVQLVGGGPKRKTCLSFKRAKKIS